MSADAPASSPKLPTRVTLRTIRQWVRAGKRFPMLTCYDATTARWLTAGGVSCLLVGDTAAEMIFGYDSTLPIKLPMLVELTASVRRGAPHAFVMADMPFGSYQCGDDDAMRNAMSFLTEGGADVVKLEVDSSFGPLVERMSRAGVPVVAHLGSRPQQVRSQGGYVSACRTEQEAAEIVGTAEEMIRRGAVMLLLEAVPCDLSQRVTEMAMLAGRRPPVPVVGCGAGPACHGHVVVLHDLVGLTKWHPPFVQPAAQLGEQLQKAAEHWAKLVDSGRYLADDHPYRLQK